MNNREAFTLIELLVVVTIIVALLAILLPSLNQAIVVANSAACRSNARQMGLAHLNYSADHLGMHAPASTDPSRPHWLELLRRYTGGLDEIRYCPETDRYEYDPNATGAPSRVGSRYETWWLKTNTYNVGFYGGGSYGVNIFTHSTSGWGSPIDKHFRAVRDSNAPSNTPFVADCIWHNSYPRDTDAPPNIEPGGTLLPDTMSRYLIRRHADGISVAMLDNSVRQVNLEDMWMLDWHKDFAHRADVTIVY